MKRANSFQNRFMGIITIPIRVLTKARDFYIQSLTDCSGKIGYGANSTVGFSGPLPRSFSVNSSRSDDGEDFAELLRVASTKSLGNRIAQMDTFSRQQLVMKLQPVMHGMGGSKGVPRSCSVGMGKIDEDKACDFGECKVVDPCKKGVLYPRSKSYAVPKRSLVL